MGLGPLNRRARAYYSVGMKTWMMVAAVVLAPMIASAQWRDGAPSEPASEASRAELLKEVQGTRDALLPQDVPLAPVTARHQPKLNEIKLQIETAKTGADLSKGRAAFGEWKALVLRSLYGENRRSILHAGESFTAFSAREAEQINFTMALRQQFAAQRLQAQTDELRSSSLLKGGWNRTFDNSTARTGSPLAASTPFAFGVADGAVRAEPATGAARYKKLRDIAVRNWGANAQIVDAAIKEAMRQNVDPALVLAVIWQESRFNPHATSSCGARGLMQVMPETGRGMGYSADSLYTVKSSLEAGVKYLKNAARYLKLNMDLSDIAEAVSKWIRTQGPNLYRIPYAETRHYVRVISDKLASLSA
jgi:soluble lytic murein transglycosylase-like protein